LTINVAIRKHGEWTNILVVSPKQDMVWHLLLWIHDSKDFQQNQGDIKNIAITSI